jgi:hypothetical protein
VNTPPPTYNNSKDKDHKASPQNLGDANAYKEHSDGSKQCRRNVNREGDCRPKSASSTNPHPSPSSKLIHQLVPNQIQPQRRNQTLCRLGSRIHHRLRRNQHRLLPNPRLLLLSRHQREGRVQSLLMLLEMKTMFKLEFPMLRGS